MPILEKSKGHACFGHSLSLAVHVVARLDHFFMHNFAVLMCVRTHVHARTQQESENSNFRSWVPPNHQFFIGFSNVNHPFWFFSLYFWFNTHFLQEYSPGNDVLISHLNHRLKKGDVSSRGKYGVDLSLNLFSGK